MINELVKKGDSAIISLSVDGQDNVIMDNNCIKAKVRDALNLFIEKDSQSLLQVDIYEPTISHRIAVYLEGLFPDHNVDCEYNNNLQDRKKTSNRKFRPDIIIHKRLEKNNNLAIIEIKKHGKKSKPARKDIKKLNDYVNGSLKYKLGIFIGVLKRKVEVSWIGKGDKEESETIKYPHK